jgi:hypothetical protein
MIFRYASPSKSEVVPVSPVLVYTFICFYLFIRGLACFSKKFQIYFINSTMALTNRSKDPSLRLKYKSGSIHSTSMRCNSLFITIPSTLRRVIFLEMYQQFCALAMSSASGCTSLYIPPNCT